MIILISHTGDAAFGPAVTSYFKTVYFVFMFMLGIAMATHRDYLLALLQGPLREGRLAFAILGIGLLGINDHLPYEAGGLGVAMGFAVVIIVTLSTEQGNVFLQSRVPQFLGKISYSLYLIHMPIMYSCLYLLIGRMPIVWILLLVFLINLPVSWLFWHLIERPSIAMSRRVSLG